MICPRAADYANATHTTRYATAENCSTPKRGLPAPRFLSAGVPAPRRVESFISLLTSDVLWGSWRDEGARGHFAQIGRVFPRDLEQKCGAHVS